LHFNTHCKVQGLTAVSCVKTAEPIAMHFGMLSWVGPENGLHGVYMPRLERALLGCLANWKTLGGWVKEWAMQKGGGLYISY